MSRFAETEEEAERRYQQYKSLDPFPDIPPALLNSADIEDYVAATGMLYQFNPTPDKVKLAAYEADFLGDVIYFDPDTRDIKRSNIARDIEFVLKPNSIAFVSIEPTLRLPLYMALRFNLKIRHVHKGLLLGTGPLVDPGFCGKLFIPLHNLTANAYSFKGGEGLIWFEFTKISQHEQWGWRGKERPFGRSGLLGRAPTPGETTTPLDYLRRAVDPGRPIISSIPDAVQKANRSAENAEAQARQAGVQAQAAKNEAERLRRIFTAIAGLGLAGLLAALVGNYLQITGFYRDSNVYLQQARHDLSVAQSKLERQNQELNPDRMSQMENSIDRLKDRVEHLEGRGGSNSRNASTGSKPHGQ